MARIEGTGIKEPSKEAKVANLNFLRNPKKFLQDKIDKKLDSYTREGKTPFGTSIGGSAVGEGGLGRFSNPNELSDASETFKRRDFFSMKTDPRNEVRTASVGNFSGTFDESDFNSYTRALGIKNIKRQPDMMQRMLRENYMQDKKEGIFRDGQIFNRTDTLLNKAPKEEKPSFIAQTKNFAGSVFDAITGTQRAEASQIPGGMPTSGTQAAPVTKSSVPAGSFGISQKGRDQAAINRGVAAAAKTGIPSGADLKAGSFGISKEGRDQAAINRGIKAAEATGIPSGANLKAGSFGISEAGRKQAATNRADAKKKTSKVSTTTKQGKPRTAAQMSAARRIASGTKPKSAKQRAQDAAKARRAAGPNRKMSDGQQTRAQAGPSARTAQGNRARVRANARKRAQAAARRRRKSKK